MWGWGLNYTWTEGVSSFYLYLPLLDHLLLQVHLGNNGPLVSEEPPACSHNPRKRKILGILVIRLTDSNERVNINNSKGF